MTNVITRSFSGYDAVSYSSSERQILQSKRAMEVAKQVVQNNGLRSDHWSGIGSENIAFSLAISNTIQTLEKQEGPLDIAINNIEMMHKALKEIGSVVAKARSTWIRSQNGASFMDKEAEIAAIRVAAEEAIQSLANFLSIQGVRGEYLFGGNIDNIPPLKQPMGKTNIISGNPSASYYQGSTHYKELYFGVSSSATGVEPITIKVKADDKWIQNTFAALYAMLDTEAWNGNIESWFKDGLEGRDNTAAELGLLQARLENIKKHNQNNVLYFKQQFDSIMKQSEQEAILAFLDTVDTFNKLADLERKVRDMFSKFLESYR